MGGFGRVGSPMGSGLGPIGGASRASRGAIRGLICGGVGLGFFVMRAGSTATVPSALRGGLSLVRLGVGFRRGGLSPPVCLGRQVRPCVIGLCSSRVGFFISLIEPGRGSGGCGRPRGVGSRGGRHAVVLGARGIGGFGLIVGGVVRGFRRFCAGPRPLRGPGGRAVGIRGVLIRR